VKSIATKKRKEKGETWKKASHGVTGGTGKKTSHRGTEARRKKIHHGVSRSEDTEGRRPRTGDTGNTGAAKAKKENQF